MAGYRAPPRALVVAAAWLLAVAGGAAAVVGGMTVLRGGSSATLFLGLLTIVAGRWVGRNDPRGRALALMLWAGLAGSAIATGATAAAFVRLLALPTALLILVFLPPLLARRR